MYKLPIPKVSMNYSHPSDELLTGEYVKSTHYHAIHALFHACVCIHSADEQTQTNTGMQNQHSQEMSQADMKTQDREDAAHSHRKRWYVE